MKSACLSIILLIFFIVSSSFNPARPAYQLVGVWESEEKNLQIEMSENDGEFSGQHKIQNKNPARVMCAGNAAKFAERFSMTLNNATLYECHRLLGEICLSCRRLFTN